MVQRVHRLSGMRAMVILAVLLVPSHVLAESSTQLVGQVTEAVTHRPLEGVVVTATAVGSQPQRTTTSTNGLYRFVLPDGGSYTMTFAFAENRFERIVPVDRGKIVTYDAPLKIAGEVIEVEDFKLPAVAAVPLRDPDRRLLPKYSDQAIEHDAWTKAWLLLDVDERGFVTRAKFLNRPGYDLEPIALEQVFATRFTPALDASGHPARSLLGWAIEWPSYWWVIALEGTAIKVPRSSLRHTPCRGSGGPWHMDSIHPTYRDCSRPDLSRATVERWIDAPK
jgi:hypothetical protein